MITGKEQEEKLIMVDKNTIIIREMQERDIHDALLMLKRGYDEMDFDANGDSFDFDSCVEFLKQNISNPSSTVLIAEDNNSIVGTIAFALYPFYMDKNNLKAVEFIWHSDPLLTSTKRGKIMILLLKTAENKIRETGASSIVLGTSPVNSIGEMLKRMDYKLASADYVKVLK